MTRPPLYHWKDTALGRAGLCQILLYAHSKATPERLLTASPGDFGVSAEELRKWVLERVPGLEEEHLAKTGLPLTGKKMMGRLYNMFTVLPTGARIPSGEHPTMHDDLAATWNVISGAQTAMFAE